MGEFEGACKVEEALVISMHPDVCKKDDKPVKYDIYAKASDDVNASPNIRYTGQFALRASSRLSTCYEDGAAKAGVISGCVQGYCRPVDEMSKSLHLNGQLAVRHDTVFEMNAKGPEGKANTRGKLAYWGNVSAALIRRRPVLYTPEGEKQFEEARQKALDWMQQHFDQPDFYQGVGEFDWMNDDLWDQMQGVQGQFQAAEASYGDPATVAYSQSMRETLHASVIDLFQDPEALKTVMSQSSTGLYDWYIGMHGTAFAENGAWNLDFLGNGVDVMKNTSPAMLKEAGKLQQGMREDDPYATLAAEQVREMRAKKGLRVTRRAGEPKPAPDADLGEPRGQLTWNPPQ